MSNFPILNILKPLYHFLHKLWEKVIYYNFFISSGAVLLTVLTALVFKIEVNIKLLFFIFFASTLTYNLDRKPQEIQNFGHLLVLNCTSTLIFLGLAFFLKTETLYYLIHLAVISVFYAIPRSFGKLRYLSLRRVPLIKIFIIAYGWACVTVILPLLEAGQEIYTQQILIEFINRFLFIFIICIPFDIGDYEDDKEEKVITIPIVFGAFNAKLIAIFLGLILLFLSQFQQYFLVHFILLLIVIFLVYVSTINKPKMFYKKYLDGTIHLYFLLYMLLG